MANRIKSIVSVLTPSVRIRSILRFRKRFNYDGQAVVVWLLLLGVWSMGCERTEFVSQQPAADHSKTNPLLPVPTLRTPKWPELRPQGLPIPTFSPSVGKVAFGTKIQISVTKLPTGSVLEYSYDSGKTWTLGDQVAVVSKDTILARTRINDLTSESAHAYFSPFFQRMLIIGNSIMSHAPAPDIGWYNFNGMAASAPEKDFVHVLTARLAALNPQIQYRLQSGGGFEREFGRSSYSLDEFNEVLRQFKPDLIIVRIGENVDEGEVRGARNYEGQFRKLLERLASGSQPSQIVTTTSVWKRPQTDAIMQKVTAERGYACVDLSSLVGRDAYFAREYPNGSVASHPNDAGMQRIADLIWKQIP